MNQRQNNRVLIWDDEENTTQHDPLKPPGGDFWRSVWKGIEAKNREKAPAMRKTEMPLQPPRDYPVDRESSIHA